MKSIKIKYYRFEFDSVEELTNYILREWTDTVGFGCLKLSYDPLRSGHHTEDYQYERLIRRVLNRACDTKHECTIHFKRGDSRFIDEPLSVGGEVYFGRPYSFSFSDAVAVRYADAASGYNIVPIVYHVYTRTYGDLRKVSRYSNEEEVIIRGLFKIISIEVDTDGIEHIYLSRIV